MVHREAWCTITRVVWCSDTCHMVQLEFTRAAGTSRLSFTEHPRWQVSSRNRHFRPYPVPYGPPLTAASYPVTQMAAGAPAGWAPRPPWQPVVATSAVPAARGAQRVYASNIQPAQRQRPTATDTVTDRQRTALVRAVNTGANETARDQRRGRPAAAGAAAAAAARNAATQWNVGTFAEIGLGINDQNVQDYVAANPGTPLGGLGFGVHAWEIEPTQMAEAWGRRDAHGALIQNNGRFLLLFQQWLSRVVAPLARSILGPRGWTSHSWWLVQVIAGDGTILATTGPQFMAPNKRNIQGVLQLLNGGPTSGEAADAMFNPGAFIRVSAYDPNIGYGAGDFPAHLNHLKTMQSVWSPPPDDGYCAVNSFVVGFEVLHGSKDRAQNLKRRKVARDKATLPYRKAINDGNGGWGFPELNELSKLTNTTIIVLDSITRRPSWVSELENDRIVTLFYDTLSKHYLFAGGIDAVHRESKWCKPCRKFVSRKPGEHRCGKFDCRTCGARFDIKAELWAHRYGGRDADPDKPQVRCGRCNAKSSAECIAVHEEKLCRGDRWQCAVCNQMLFTNPKHQRYMSKEMHDAEFCGKGYKWCTRCLSHMEPKHTCYIRPLDVRSGYKFNPKHPVESYAFDLESAVDADGRQVPVLVVVYRIVELEENESMNEFKDRVRTFYEEEAKPIRFEGLNCMRLFATWLITCKAKMRILGHNAKGYDGPALEYVLREMGVTVTATKAGHKTIRIAWGPNGRGGVMTCSMALFPSSLDKFAKAMIGVDAAKDRFPHSMHTPDGDKFKALNGAFPPVEAYLMDGLGRENEQTVRDWHREESAKYKPNTEIEWDYWSVLNKYCDKDTMLLAWALSIYRKAFFDLTTKTSPDGDDGDDLLPGLDILDCTTVASAAQKAFQYKFMDHLGPDGIRTPTAEEDPFIRLAAKGGRTEQFTTGVDLVKNPLYDEEGRPLVIHASDFTSHYPAQQINPTLLYPHGVPEWIEGSTVDIGRDLERILKMCGFTKVDYLPPDDPPDGFLPILPCTNPDTGRLEFNLLPGCGTFDNLELELAVQHGYRVTKVHRALVYPAAIAGIFAPYMREFFAGKMHASKPPNGPLPPIIRRFAEEYGIELDEAKLLQPEDPVMRALYKLFLNSLWGKFGQTGKPKTETVDAPTFHRTIDDHVTGKIKLVDVSPCPVLLDRFIVSYFDVAKEEELIHNNTHVGLSTRVLAAGRVGLWRHASLYGRRLMYMDTDSFFYLAPKDYVPPGTGDGIGELLPEFKTHALRAAILGPKTYYFDNPDTGEVKMALKGVPINAHNKKYITYGAFMDVIRNTDLRLHFKSFHMRRRPGEIFAVTERKVVGYNPWFAKRQPVAYGEFMPPWSEENDDDRHELPSRSKRLWSDTTERTPLPPPKAPRPIQPPTADEKLEVAASLESVVDDVDEGAVSMDEDDLKEVHEDIERSRAARRDTPLARAVLDMNP
jgi:hypothetical protein